MKCIRCDHPTRVSKSSPSQLLVRRTRQCPSCGFRFHTRERRHLNFRVRKTGAEAMPFDEQRLLASLRPCFVDVPEPEQQMLQTLAVIVDRLSKEAEQEISATRMIEIVKDQLALRHPMLAERYLALRPMRDPPQYHPSGGQESENPDQESLF